MWECLIALVLLLAAYCPCVPPVIALPALLMVGFLLSAALSPARKRALRIDAPACRGSSAPRPVGANEDRGYPGGHEYQSLDRRARYAAQHGGNGCSDGSGRGGQNAGQMTI